MARHQMLRVIIIKVLCLFIATASSSKKIVFLFDDVQV
jgi:hypothetical protein